MEITRIRIIVGAFLFGVSIKDIAKELGIDLMTVETTIRDWMKPGSVKG